MKFAASMMDIQSLIDVIPNIVVVKNHDHRMVMVNSQACAFLGYDRETLLNSSDDDLFTAQQVIGFHEADDQVFATGVIVEREEQITDGLGAIRHVITRKQLAVLDGFDYLVAVVTDVTGYREAEARSRYLTFHDALTGLANRVMFKERIERAISRPSGCAALLINLDHFKKVNDSFGHPVGDELLVQFGQRLSGIVQACDTVARLGSDTFAILLTDLDDQERIEEHCRRILTAASQAFDLSGVHATVTASIGVVLPQSGPMEPSELHRRADVALYQAKSDGRGCWCIYTEELDRRFRHRRSTEADLRAALEAKTGIEIYYQPLAAMMSGQVIGFEALARWRHPTRGLIMPDDFIPIAETSGLIVELGGAVLRKACSDAAAWEPPLRLSVNVSPMQFVQGDFISLVKDALGSSGLDPTRLELEITEGVLIDDANGTLSMLTHIRELGVSIVLDDFGTGFSSLGYLRHFPFSKVKIDKSFITDMMTNRESATIVEAVLLICKSLSMKVVAEGIETKEQFTLLRDLGCTQAQGYLIGRPMPLESFVGSILSR